LVYFIVEQYAGRRSLTNLKNTFQLLLTAFKFLFNLLDRQAASAVDFVLGLFG
jgi:hypothetical protein